MAKKCGTCSFMKPDMKLPQRCGPFRLDGGDAAMFDHFAQEHVEASGTEVLYWHQNLETSIRDPLYDEPIEREWQGPFRFIAYVEYTPGTPQMREEGMTVRWEGRLWVARKTLEDQNIPAPLEGDVMQFWDNRFFREHGVNGEEGAEGGYYFDITNVDDDGHVQDSSHFVGLTINFIRRTEFTAERRLNS